MWSAEPYPGDRQTRVCGPRLRVGSPDVRGLEKRAKGIGLFVRRSFAVQTGKTDLQSGRYEFRDLRAIVHLFAVQLLWYVDGDDSASDDATAKRDIRRVVGVFVKDFQELE